MKWSEFKKEITHLSPEEKAQLELMATVASVRKSKNLTQEQLARKANVTQAQVARVENFSYTPSLATLVKILDGLDVDIALVDRETKTIIAI